MGDGPDIWTRLAKIDVCCHVSIHSLYVTRPSGEMQREWEVTIRRKGGGTEPAVIVRDPSLGHAVEEALLRADRLGWHGEPENLSQRVRAPQGPQRRRDSASAVTGSVLAHALPRPAVGAGTLGGMAANENHVSGLSASNRWLTGRADSAVGSVYR